MAEITLKFNRIRCSLKRLEVRRVMEAIFSKDAAATKIKSKKKTTKPRLAKGIA